MQADERFVAWLAGRREADKFGHVYQYHPRSDVHSKVLCRLIVADLLVACPAFAAQARASCVAYGINVGYHWPSGKHKTIDLAIGRPIGVVTLGAVMPGIAEVRQIGEVLVSCEAKTVMTEHGKSQPRIFDELSSSHEIVHRGNDRAIAAGITVVNIAQTFVSPTRNQTTAEPLVVSPHNQPHVTARMVQHLRGLRVREEIGETGFDAYCTFVVDCDNQGHAALWTDPPAPQPGDSDHYDTFLGCLARLYCGRFGRNPGG